MVPVQRFSICFSIAILLASLLQGCPAPISNSTLAIEVFDGATNERLTDVDITLRGGGVPNGLRGELIDGAFIYLLTIGTEVSVTVRADGYETESITVEVGDFIDDLTVILTPLEPPFVCADNLLGDPGFETGNNGPAWEESSTSFARPIVCCRPSPGTGAYTGDWWVWFGGFDEGMEEASLTQTVTIPAGTGASLSFYLEIPEAEVPGSLTVSLDGTTVYSATEGDRSIYAFYQLVTVSLPEAADGMEHTIRFDASTGAGGLTSFFIDDMCLTSTP